MVGLAEQGRDKSGESSSASPVTTSSETTTSTSISSNSGAWTALKMASMELLGRLDDDSFSGKWRFNDTSEWYEFELGKQAGANGADHYTGVTFAGHIKYMENNAITSVSETMQLRVSSGSHYSGIGKNVKFGNFELWGQRDEVTKQFQGFKKYVPMNDHANSYKFVTEVKQQPQLQSQSQQQQQQHHQILAPQPQKASSGVVAPLVNASSPALSLASTSSSSKRMRVADKELMAGDDIKGNSERVENALAVFDDSGDASDGFDAAEDLLSEFQLIADVPADTMGSLSDDDLIIDDATVAAVAPSGSSLVEASPLSKVAAMSAAVRASQTIPPPNFKPLKRKPDIPALTIATHQHSDVSTISSAPTPGVSVRLNDALYDTGSAGIDTSKGRARRRVRDFVIGLQNRHFYPYDPNDVAHGLPPYHPLHDYVEVVNGDDLIIRAPSASPSKLAAKNQHVSCLGSRLSSASNASPKGIKIVPIRVNSSSGKSSVGKSTISLGSAQAEVQEAKVELDGSCYEGELLGGLRHGRGTLGYYNGCIYVGEFRKGVEHGMGELRDAQGALLYRGMFDSGKMSGSGTLYYPDGSVYRGDVRDGSRHGRGIIWYSNGSVYEGDFSHGERHGNGIFIGSDGSQYTGEWAHDLRHGKGVVKGKDGTTIDGHFKDNNPDGRCVVHFASEEAEYEGNLKDGLKDGRGTYRFKKFNAVYEGRFTRDCIGGTGTLKMDPGTVIELPNKTDDKLSEWMIPVDLNCEVRLAHFRAGFGADGT